MSNTRVLSKRTLFLFLGLLSLGLFFWTKGPARMQHSLAKKGTQLTKSRVAEILKTYVNSYQFPSALNVDLNGDEEIPATVHYSFNSGLQKDMEQVIQSYNPDYAAFVAIDPKSGRILSMVSHSKFKVLQDNLALRATFPSASVFKVVTAAAAIEGSNVSADTLVAFNGRKHTLYKNQILKSKVTQWTRYITLKEAFAYSINTVFGRLGAFSIGSERLREYADRFGFNHEIATDIPFQEGRAFIPNDVWGLAESASGFTRENKMSPLQGALIAATIANDGVMMAPYTVQSVTRSDGTAIYSAIPEVNSVVIDPDTASQIRILMKETVRRGTSRGSFRGFFKREFSFLDVGGKTGSLTGLEPPGKYDWFVGYANSGTRKIAFAALTIHEKYWTVKSSYLARKAIESFFKAPVIPRKSLATSNL
jgi:penicillin-binding protein A